MIAMRRYIKSLGSIGIHASRIVLFGSFARGDADEFSDIDLVVIAPEFDGPREMTLVEKLGWRQFLPIIVLSLFRAVKRSGKPTRAVLYSKSPGVKVSSSPRRNSKFRIPPRFDR